ncbi:MAG: hypothetical protein OXU22_02760 [Gammaproteobacteria bacterium]|nr:hypothetical protein [Gammaproteobacteria bacterium]
MSGLPDPGATLPAGHCKPAFGSGDGRRANGRPCFYSRAEIAFRGG